MSLTIQALYNSDYTFRENIMKVMRIFYLNKRYSEKQIKSYSLANKELFTNNESRFALNIVGLGSIEGLLDGIIEETGKSNSNKITYKFSDNKNIEYSFLESVLQRTQGNFYLSLGSVLKVIAKEAFDGNIYSDAVKAEEKICKDLIYRYTSRSSHFDNSICFNSLLYISIIKDIKKDLQYNPSYKVNYQNGYKNISVYFNILKTYDDFLDAVVSDNNNWPNTENQDFHFQDIVISRNKNTYKKILEQDPNFSFLKYLLESFGQNSLNMKENILKLIEIHNIISTDLVSIVDTDIKVILKQFSDQKDTNINTTTINMDTFILDYSCPNQKYEYEFSMLTALSILIPFSFMIYRFGASEAQKYNAKMLHILTIIDEATIDDIFSLKDQKFKITVPEKGRSLFSLFLRDGNSEYLLSNLCNSIYQNCINNRNSSIMSAFACRIDIISPMDAEIKTIKAFIDIFHANLDQIINQTVKKEPINNAK